MRTTLIHRWLFIGTAVLAAMASPVALAGALEDCYTMANGSEDGVNECLSRHLDAAKQRVAADQERLMDVALAIDNANHRGYYVPEYSSAQRRWEESAEKECDMSRTSAGSGAAGQNFKASCLIESYNKRTQALQQSLIDLRTGARF